MGGDQRSVRVLLALVFVPVLVLVGVLATAVLGNGNREDRVTVTPTVAAAAAVAAAAPPVAAPAPPVAAPAPPAIAPPAVAPPAPQPAPVPQAIPAEAVPQPEPAYVPQGAERIDVGSGPQSAAVFRRPGAAGLPGPVVIFLHGWVAIDPARYGPWIGHLVRDDGATVIFPAYQVKPAYDTASPLANALAGIRAAFEQVRIGPGRLVAAGHSAGGSLAADYAAVAMANGLPAPAAVFSIYPGRKLRHLPLPIPSADLSTIAPGTRVLAYAGERDTAVGSGTARRIVAGAPHADTTLQVITDDAVDDHSAPRRFDGTAQRTFWQPLDDLLMAQAQPPPS